MASIPNRLPGLNFDLGEASDMLRSQVEAFAAAEVAVWTLPPDAYAPQA